jgi:hypothetical protein
VRSNHEAAAKRPPSSAESNKHASWGRRGSGDGDSD